MNTLYMVHVTEHEYEAGWGASTRPDGIAFSDDKDALVKSFTERRIRMQEQDTRSYQLYETISSSKLVKVSDDCKRFFDFKTKGKDDKILWLRGESLKEFMEGVEF